MGVLLAVLLAGAAGAAWTGPRAVDTRPLPCRGRYCEDEGPTVAINRHGVVAAGWRRLSRPAAHHRLIPASPWVAVGDAHGRFGPPQRLARADDTAPIPTVAVHEDGSAIAVWGTSRGLRFARRRPGHRFGAARPLSEVDRTFNGFAADAVSRVVPQADGSAVVVWQRRFRRMYARRIAPDGAPGPAFRLLDIPAAGGAKVATSPEGDIAVCCTFVGDQGFADGTRLALLHPGHPWSRARLTLPPGVQVQGLVVTPTHVTLGVVDVAICHEGGCFGRPGITTVVAPGFSAAPVRDAPVLNPREGFNPVPVEDAAGRVALVYQEADYSADLDGADLGTLQAVVGDAAGPLPHRTTIDHGYTSEPAVIPGPHGAHVVFTDAASAIRVATIRDGVVARRVGTVGRRPEDDAFVTDGAGDRVVVGWSDPRGILRVSLGAPAPQRRRDAAVTRTRRRAVG